MNRIEWDSYGAAGLYTLQHVTQVCYKRDSITFYTQIKHNFAKKIETKKN